MTVITFFDTETTGLPKYKNASNHPDQPRIVQFAYITTDEHGNEITHANMICQTDVEIGSKAQEVHGIDYKKTVKYGVRQTVLANVIRSIYDYSDILVAHNAKFDNFLCKAHLARLGVELENNKLYCTLENSKDLIQLPPTEKMKRAGFNKFKQPNLMEAHQFFFRSGFDGAHDALADVKACKRVYFALMEELKKRELVKSAFSAAS